MRDGDFINIKKFDNVEVLFDIVKGCNGPVHLISQEGDDILLTSKISRVFLEVLKNDESDIVDELEIRCEDPSDEVKFLDYLMRG